MIFVEHKKLSNELEKKIIQFWKQNGVIVNEIQNIFKPKNDGFQKIHFASFFHSSADIVHVEKKIYQYFYFLVIKKFDFFVRIICLHNSFLNKKNN